MRNTLEIIDLINSEIKRTRCLLAAQLESHAEEGVTIQRTKTRLAEQEFMLRLCYGM